MSATSGYSWSIRCEEGGMEKLRNYLEGVLSCDEAGPVLYSKLNGDGANEFIYGGYYNC
jgi:hypothetical protein